MFRCALPHVPREPLLSTAALPVDISQTRDLFGVHTRCVRFGIERTTGLFVDPPTRFCIEHMFRGRAAAWCHGGSCHSRRTPFLLRSFVWKVHERTRSPSRPLHVTLSLKPNQPIRPNARANRRRQCPDVSQSNPQVQPAQSRDRFEFPAAFVKPLRCCLPETELQGPKLLTIDAKSCLL